MVVQVNTTIGSQVIVVGDISITDSNITVVGEDFPFRTDGCLSLTNGARGHTCTRHASYSPRAATLNIQLESEPPGDRYYVPNAACVNGTLNSVKLFVRTSGCRRYHPNGEVRDSNGLAVLIKTDSSGCNLHSRAIASLRSF